MKKIVFLLVTAVFAVFLVGCASSASSASSSSSSSNPKPFTPRKGTLSGVEYQVMDIGNYYYYFGNEYYLMKVSKDGKYFVTLTETARLTDVGIKNVRGTDFPSDNYFVTKGPYTFDIDGDEYKLEATFTKDRVNSKLIISKSAILTQDILGAIYIGSVIKIDRYPKPFESNRQKNRFFSPS